MVASEMVKASPQPSTVQRVVGRMFPPRVDARMITIDLTGCGVNE